MTTIDADSARVLIFAPIGRDASASADLLRRVGLSACVCTGLEDLLVKIADGAAAVFLAEEGLFGKDISGLSEWVAGQPPWSDLPFIVLTSHQEQHSVAIWRERLVSSLRNVSLLERPVHAITLTSTVRAAVRARRRQYEVRELLLARERAGQELEAQVVARTRELEEANRALRTQMAERARIEEALRQSQRLEAIGQLTGGVAHDFNNLLMVISGGLQMLDRQTDQPRRQKLMEGMRQAAQRGAGLTRQLLSFSRRQPLKPEPVDLAHSIGGMRELLDRSLGQNVRVELDFPEDLWPIEADPGELELVVLNLVVNARDAMPAGGTITVRAENKPSRQTEELQGDHVCLSVSDTGTGMTPEVRERVFEPFFTTKEIGRGSGLGLAQVYGFVKQSSGVVRIDSEPGRGTNVMLFLPRSTGHPRPRRRKSVDRPPDHDKARPAGCVLLVEDDDEVAMLVSEMLAELGFEVIRAATAAAALGALADGRNIDIVFSDIVMPGDMNGFELAREIRRRRSSLPVLLTSGYSELVKRKVDTEGVRILPKPYRLEELGGAIRTAMNAPAPRRRTGRADGAPG